MSSGYVLGAGVAPVSSILYQPSTIILFGLIKLLAELTLIKRKISLTSSSFKSGSVLGSGSRVVHRDTHSSHAKGAVKGWDQAAELGLRNMALSSKSALDCAWGQLGAQGRWRNQVLWEASYTRGCTLDLTDSWSHFLVKTAGTIISPHSWQKPKTCTGKNPAQGIKIRVNGVVEDW